MYNSYNRADVIWKINTLQSLADQPEKRWAMTNQEIRTRLAFWKWVLLELGAKETISIKATITKRVMDEIREETK